jgi:hypothetical protein
MNKIEIVTVLLVTTIGLLALGVILGKCTRMPYGGSVNCNN